MKRHSEEEEEKGFTIPLMGANFTIEFGGEVPRVYGSIPKSEDILRKWVDSKGPIPEESLEEKIEGIGIAQEPGDDADEIVESRSCGFRSVTKDGVRVLAMRDFQVKACINHAATALGLTVSHRGLKAILRSSFQIRPQFIPFMRDGKPISIPDGEEDFIGHIVDKAGRRSILKRCDTIEGSQLTFDCLWVGNKLTAPVLRDIIRYAGQFQGLGSQRRFEAGKFNLVAYSEHENPPIPWD